MIGHPGFENERNEFQNNNQKTDWADKMKIKVESEKIIKAVKKLEGKVLSVFGSRRPRPFLAAARF
jgi:hypothetical protein